MLAVLTDLPCQKRILEIESISYLFQTYYYYISNRRARRDEHTATRISSIGVRTCQNESLKVCCHKLSQLTELSRVRVI
ncbi:hypothetical protein PanWU01x14_016290 [Parasponia andersonii]|uniref:Uncharacterized protein n=1 Tax=Parasponia andersonii TaxID=3476 RepID=A0A2P5DZN7_PARAD|nr:hypothetical protein PanWU01x14_016290 [Parasponia andersonii]